MLFLQRINQVVNEAISAVRGVPLTTAHFTYGGAHYGHVSLDHWAAELHIHLYRKKSKNTALKIPFRTQPYPEPFDVRLWASVCIQWLRTQLCLDLCFKVVFVASVIILFVLVFIVVLCGVPDQWGSLSFHMSIYIV